MNIITAHTLLMQKLIRSKTMNNYEFSRKLYASAKDGGYISSSFVLISSRVYSAKSSVTFVRVRLYENITQLL